MRRTLMIATLTLGLALSHGASATDPKPVNNDELAGEVTAVDRTTNRIKVRSEDGVLHEFEASKATVDELKVGDQIKARKRPEQK